ncbi:hypothetical protein SDC9_167180 [bioreactor metagenome]|uniref:Uncharacterized protein n=1 Tax=bioreactor metagenome TaxID=1076179 RepID=A0A645FZ24_9ZZZZ
MHGPENVGCQRIKDQRNDMKQRHRNADQIHELFHRMRTILSAQPYCCVCRTEASPASARRRFGSGAGRPPGREEIPVRRVAME